MRACTTPVVLLFAASVASAQNSFDVASIKVHQGDHGGGRPNITTSGTRFRVEARLLPALIAYAYDVKLYLVADSAALHPFAEAFYDIDARLNADPPPSPAAFRDALKQLLAGRFHLALHSEKRELPVYALIIGKNGSKLQKADPTAETKVHYAEAGRNWEATCDNASTDELLRVIDNSILDRPLVDRTGLTGSWRFKLTYTPQIPPNKRNPDPDDILIFEAVERQLGLRLEPRKEPVDMLIVDRAERPTAN
jgi:uncharacterized protein (TIGR03435 family)